MEHSAFDERKPDEGPSKIVVLLWYCMGMLDHCVSLMGSVISAIENIWCQHQGLKFPATIRSTILAWCAAVTMTREESKPVSRLDSVKKSPQI